MDQDDTCHGGRYRSRPHCARWGPSSPPQNEAEPTIVLGTEIGLGLRDIVLDGDARSTFPIKGAEPPPQFSAHFYCGQTAACIKMPLGMEVGLSTGDSTQSPKFSAHVYL